MGIRRAGVRAPMNLTEVVGELIGLRFAGVAKNVTTTIPDRGEVTQDVPRARLVLFAPDGSKATELGETLVFHQAIAREITATPDEWYIGLLERREQVGDASRSVYVLSSPEKDAEAVFERMETALAEAKLS